MYPIIFQTQHLTLYTLWIFVAIAVFVSTYATIKLAIAHKLKLQFLSNNILNISFIALLGARLFSIIENFNLYFTDFSSNKFWQLLTIWDNNLSSMGAIIAVILYLKFLTKKQEQNYLQWLDALIPATIIGLAVGHIGNFLDGNAYGHETQSAWGINLENPAIKYTDVLIHPTQIYAFLYSVIIFITLNFIRNHSTKLEENTKNQGFIAILGISLYSLAKFIEEFFRGDDTLLINENSFFIQWLRSDDSTLQFSIRFPQVIALITFIFSSIYLYRNYKDVLLSIRKTK